MKILPLIVMSQGNGVKGTGIVARIPGENSKGFPATITMEAEHALHLRGQGNVTATVEKDGVLHNNPRINLNLSLSLSPPTS
jgi:hypothetical protein